MFGRKFKKALNDLRNDVERRLHKAEQDLAEIRCEAGKHAWELKDEQSLSPTSPPYLRCKYCWKRPDVKKI